MKGIVMVLLGVISILASVMLMWFWFGSALHDPWFEAVAKFAFQMTLFFLGEGLVRYGLRLRREWPSAGKSGHYD